MVGRSTYEGLRTRFSISSRAAPVDVVLFGLHGAMVADGYDDCEGDLLARARAIVVLNGDRGRARSTLSPQRPHGGYLERGRHLQGSPAHGFSRTRRGAGRSLPAHGAPRDHACDVDRRLSRYCKLHNQPGAGRSLVDRIKALEGRDAVLSISIIHGFPAADVYELAPKCL